MWNEKEDSFPGALFCVLTHMLKKVKVGSVPGRQLMATLDFDK